MYLIDCRVCGEPLEFSVNPGGVLFNGDVCRNCGRSIDDWDKRGAQWETCDPCECCGKDRELCPCRFATVEGPCEIANDERGSCMEWGEALCCTEHGALWSWRSP